MKKALIILVVALAAGVAAFWITRSQQQAAHQGVLLDSIPELAWLRRDLKLSDAQFAKASELHAAYRPQCAAMCRRIAQTQARMRDLARHARSLSPELVAAIDEHARVRAECQQKMLEHLYQTAALLDDPQAARYLATVLPVALDSTAGGSVDCQSN